MADRRLPRARAVVKRNGSPVSFKSASYVRSIDKVAPSWSINLKHPVVYNTSDTWTLQRGILGDLTTLVDGETAKNWNRSEGLLSNTRSISGTAETGDLLSYCVPKILVFVSLSWIKELEPTAVIEDGIVKVQRGGAGVGGGIHTERYYHPSLPGRDIADDEFECIIGPETHHDIGQYLCNLTGYGFVCNTPDVALVDTYTVDQGTTWFDAIKHNFLIWSPDVQIHDGNIYILDLYTNSGAVTGVQKISISDTALITITEDDSGTGVDEIIDHVIVEGRPTKDSIVLYPREIDTTIIEISGSLLNIDEVKRWEQPIETLVSHKQMGSYTGSFEEGDDEYTVSAVTRTRHTNYYNVDSQTQRRKLVRAVVDTVLSDGTLVAKETRTHYHGPNGRPVKTIIKEEGLVPVPGQSSPQWKHYRNRIILQNRFVKGLNLTLTSEIVEGLVLYEETDSGDKVSPISLWDIRRADKTRTAVDKDSETTQQLMEMTTNYRWTIFDREDDKTLWQIIYDYDVLTGEVKATPQVLDNPIKDEPEQDSEEIPFRKEYHPVGSGKTIGTYGTCYHTPKTISHRDLTTEAQLDAVAERVLGKRGSRQITATITTNIPIPIQSLGILVALPQLSYDVDGSSVDVPSGDYVLREVREDITFSETLEGPVEYQFKQVLVCRRVSS